MAVLVSLTWWQSWGAVSPLWVSGSPRGAGPSPAASYWCTRPFCATWWPCWSVPVKQRHSPMGFLQIFDISRTPILICVIKATDMHNPNSVAATAPKWHICWTFSFSGMLPTRFSTSSADCTVRRTKLLAKVQSNSHLPRCLVLVGLLLLTYYKYNVYHLMC